MVYPHEKIQYITTEEHAEVQDHATSPIFLKERIQMKISSQERHKLGVTPP